LIGKILVDGAVPIKGILYRFYENLCKTVLIITIYFAFSLIYYGT